MTILYGQNKGTGKSRDKRGEGTESVSFDCTVYCLDHTSVQGVRVELTALPYEGNDIPFV